MLWAGAAPKTPIDCLKSKKRVAATFSVHPGKNLCPVTTGYNNAGYNLGISITIRAATPDANVCKTTVTFRKTLPNGTVCKTLQPPKDKICKLHAII